MVLLSMVVHRNKNCPSRSLSNILCSEITTHSFPIYVSKHLYMSTRLTVHKSVPYVNKTVYLLNKISPILFSTN